MSYGNLGQPRPGHLHGMSSNPKSASGSSKTPSQTQRGFGGAKSRNTVTRGKPNGEGQRVRGYPSTKSTNRRSGGKGR